MLTKLHQHNGITHFLVNEHFFLGTAGNRLIDLHRGVELLETPQPLGNIISNGATAFVSDWYGDTKKIENNKVVDFNNTVSAVLANDMVLCDSRNPAQTTLLNNAFVPLWTVDFRIPSMSVYTNETIFFRDRRGEGRIVAVDLMTGEVTWSKTIHDIRHGADFGSFVGVKELTLILETRKPDHIVMLDVGNGNVQNVISNDLTEKYHIGLDYFQLDSKVPRLVRPEGEIDLEKMQFIPRDFFLPWKNVEHLGRDFTVTFPFAIDEGHVFFGIQMHIGAQTDNYRSVGKLMVLNRQTGDIVYSSLINEGKEDAGIKQIIKFDRRLYLLDTTDSLSIYEM